MKPPIDKHVDLRDFRFMPLRIDLLQNSETWALACDHPFAAGACINLWIRAWHQVPAGSLPNDERLLKKWAGVPECDAYALHDIILRGFVEADDGKLYHPVIVAEAKRANHERERYRKASKARWEKKKSNDATHMRRTSNAPCVAHATDHALQSKGQGQEEERKLTLSSSSSPPLSPPQKAREESASAQPAPTPRRAQPTPMDKARAIIANGKNSVTEEPPDPLLDLPDYLRRKQPKENPS